jgi:antitoxin HicB
VYMADTPVKTVEYYMSLPYTVEVGGDDEAGYFAEVLELPGCTSEAETLEELKPKIKDAQLAWIEAALEAGDPVPEPLPEPTEQ